MPNQFKEQGGLRLFLFFILFLVMFKGLADAADWQAKVIHIADGDTITVLNAAKEQIRIRLNGIDPRKRASLWQKGHGIYQLHTEVYLKGGWARSTISLTKSRSD
jgi:endonuclease YncB( thermonuclease family)